MHRAYFLLCLFLLPAYSLHAQFALSGQAAYMDGDCIQLTADTAYAEGIAFYSTPINLEHPFQISFDLFFGEKDEGADGMTFVIHDDPRGLEAFGVWGEGMGYGRWNPSNPHGTSISPSIAVEFDTYQNIRQNDPANDHIALLENGSSYHTLSYPDKDPAFNLEDGRLHDFVFSWNPAQQSITVLLDGQLVASRNLDLVNTIFNGKTEVIWGFTASTGRKFNLQYFCLKRLARH